MTNLILLIFIAIIAINIFSCIFDIVFYEHMDKKMKKGNRYEKQKRRHKQV